MFLRQIYDPHLAQYSYVIGCQKTGEAIVIDPLRDVEQYQKVAANEGLRLSAVAETHIHADFVSGAIELADAGSDVYLPPKAAPTGSLSGLRTFPKSTDSRTATFSISATFASMSSTPRATRQSTSAT